MIIGMRHLDAGHAAHREDVVIVERGRADADHDVAVGHDRIRKIGHVFETVDAPCCLSTTAFIVFSVFLDRTRRRVNRGRP